MLLLQTPKGVVCEGRKVLGTIPTLPDYYHYRQEIIQEGSSHIYQADVRMQFHNDIMYTSMFVLDIANTDH